MSNIKSESKIVVRTEGNLPYDILMKKSFKDLGGAVEALGCKERRICIVSDTNVAPLYLEEVKKSLAGHCAKVETFVFEAGEQNKNLSVVQRLYEALILAGFDRKDYLLALGGGVVGDLTGFAAATYLRGIKFIQVPTTLLSQIDSSVGGKTGVDFDQYKNMVGAFHQPSLVYMNIKVLNTLPEVQFASGMGELLKYGISLDADFYEWTLDHMGEIMECDEDIMSIAVSHCCKLKRDIVEKDPTDKGLRALLNFGHTIGHAIEKLKNFTLAHGECVALGTVAAAYISWNRGMIEEDEFYEIRDMNVPFGLPISFDSLASEDILAATRKDKKMEAGKISFILLKKLGKAYVDTTVTDEEMLEAINFLNADVAMARNKIVLGQENEQ